jgi:hypothetical protein
MLAIRFQRMSNQLLHLRMRARDDRPTAISTDVN